MTMPASVEQASPYAGLRLETKEHATAAAEPELAEPRAERVVSLRAILDALSMWLIVAGGGCGVAAAFLAGGTVPGLATLGGVLVALGVMLTL